MATGEAGGAAGSVSVDVGGGSESAVVLETCRLALREHRRLHLSYLVPSRDERTERDVDPMRLLSVEGRWYLEAWCRRVEDVRLFRLDRVDDVAVLDEPAAPPEQARSRDLDSGLYQAGEDQPLVRLRLARTARWVADYYPVEDVAEVDDPPGGLAVSVRTADPAWARRLVASLGGAAVVDEPAELADEVAAEARAALARYPDRPTLGGPAGADGD